MYINRSNSSWGEGQAWGMPEVWATREPGRLGPGEHFKPYHAKAIKALQEGKVRPRDGQPLSYAQQDCPLPVS